LRSFVVFASFICFCNASSLPASEAVSFQTTQFGVDIHIGKQRVAEFVHTEDPPGRPFISNVHTRDGIQVTRNYPVKEDDQADHPHHQGIFHTFSQLNGIDYWHMHGITRHRRFVREPQVGTKTGFVTENLYLANDRKKVLVREVISYEFAVTPLGLLIVIDAVITPHQDDVTLGSREEGGLAVRLASDLRVESGAEMVDDRGRVGGGEIWGKTARWVDNSGMKEGRWVGVTVMTHPENQRLYHWHARNYGLLTVNPLGPLNTAPDRILKNGDSMRFRYGVLIHSSENKQQYNPAKAQVTYEHHTSTQSR